MITAEEILEGLYPNIYKYENDVLTFWQAKIAMQEYDRQRTLLLRDRIETLIGALEQIRECAKITDDRFAGYSDFIYHTSNNAIYKEK